MGMPLTGGLGRRKEQFLNLCAVDGEFAGLDHYPTRSWDHPAV